MWGLWWSVVGGGLTGTEIHCPAVAYQDTVSRHVHRGANFFFHPSLRDSRAKSGDKQHLVDPVPCYLWWWCGPFRTMAWEDPYPKLSAWVDMMLHRTNCRLLDELEESLCSLFTHRARFRLRLFCMIHVGGNELLRGRRATSHLRPSDILFTLLGKSPAHLGS